MKKTYVKPVIEIERYELDASIAANCGNIVTLGPGDYEDHVCEEFDNAFAVAAYSARSSSTSFYNGETGPICDCYYSSGGQGYFTS